MECSVKDRATAAHNSVPSAHKILGEQANEIASHSVSHMKNPRIVNPESYAIKLTNFLP